MTELADRISQLRALPNCEQGGPLHIIVDDFNVRDGDLNYCERTLAEHWSVEEAAPDDRVRIQAVSLAILALLWPMRTQERRDALRASA